MLEGRTFQDFAKLNFWVCQKKGACRNHDICLLCDKSAHCINKMCPLTEQCAPYHCSRGMKIPQPGLPPPVYNRYKKTDVSLQDRVPKGEWGARRPGIILYWKGNFFCNRPFTGWHLDLLGVPVKKKHTLFVESEMFQEKLLQKQFHLHCQDLSGKI